MYNNIKCSLKPNQFFDVNSKPMLRTFSAFSPFGLLSSSSTELRSFPFFPSGERKQEVKTFCLQSSSLFPLPNVENVIEDKELNAKNLLISKSEKGKVEKQSNADL